jgi:cupin domain
MAEKPIVNIVDVPLLDRGNGEKFVAKWGRVAPLLGLSNLGCAVHVVPPGKRAFPFHRHHVADELFFIVSGEGEYRWGNKVFPLRPGDIIAARPAPNRTRSSIPAMESFAISAFRPSGALMSSTIPIPGRWLSLPASRMPIFPRRHLEGWAASSQPTISTARRETRVTSKA